MTKRIINFFDKLEDKTRSKLSRMPIIYALIGSIGLVLFWRGVWYLADDINLGSIFSTTIGIVILLLTGVFVSTFVGNRLIISGLSGEKKLAEKTEEDIETEEKQIEKIQNTIEKVEKDISKIESEIKHHHMR